MRNFLSRSIPPFSRVLLVESGSRQRFEELLPGLYQTHPEMEADLATCFAGLPEAFREDRGRVYRINNYPAGPARKRLFAELRTRGYDVVGIICSAEPIMTKWKWALAFRIPAKVFILNENSDYFWLDWNHWYTIRHFVIFRSGLAGAGAVRTVARLVLFPFTLAYLVLYAAMAHLRRRLRTL
jgi:hypothetical protein